MGLNKLGRYGHRGYLIKVVAMALAEEVTREPPSIHGLLIIMSKASEKGKGWELHVRGKLHVTDTVRTTGPARKRYFFTPAILVTTT